MLSQNLCEKVLTVGCEYHPPRGGIAQVLYNYEHYVFPRFKFVANSKNGNFVSKLFQFIGGLIRMAYMLQTDKAIRIVHIHTASYNSFRRSMWFVRLAKSKGRKVLLHIHGGAFREFYATNPKGICSDLKKCDCIVTLSPLWKQWFNNTLGKMRVEVVENVIPKPNKRCGILQDGIFHLLYLGLITEKKGIFDVLQVLAENKEELIGKLCLHIAGNGKVKELQDFVQSKGLHSIVRYEGWANDDKKSLLLSMADAFILPSYTEGSPMSILEALSYGLPVIATKVGGIPEIVSDGANGILFVPGDLKEIDRILHRFVTDSDKTTKLLPDIQNNITRYLPDAVSERLAGIYNSLLSK